MWAYIQRMIFWDLYLPPCIRMIWKYVQIFWKSVQIFWKSLSFPLHRGKLGMTRLITCLWLCPLLLPGRIYTPLKSLWLHFRPFYKSTSISSIFNEYSLNIIQCSSQLMEISAQKLGLKLFTPQSGALRRGAFRDFQSNPIYLGYRL